MRPRPLALVLAAAVTPLAAQVDAPTHVVYRGGDGPGRGKQVVLVSGDEEYRSEEALPQLGRILAFQHGFTCTVLFAVDPGTGIVQPNCRSNIPGLAALADADVMVIATRYRNLPSEQMQAIDDYLRRGGPVLGMRTATHAFKIPADAAFARYSDGYAGDYRAWHGGFGRLVLGEQWISHHGHHGKESTRGVIADGAGDHPIVRGLQDGDVWGPTDVYGVRLPLPGDSQPLVLGQVLSGMTPDAAPVDGAKNAPMLPVAWVKSYRIPDGKEGRAFTTTMGAATDLSTAGTRRLLVQATYWLAGLGDAIPEEGARVDLVGDFQPTAYSFQKDEHWVALGRRPADLRWPAAAGK